MSRLRAHLGWLLRGHIQVTDALESLSRDLRELQHKVGELDHAIAAMPKQVEISRISTELAISNAAQLKHLQATRDACDRATDDLAERIAAIHERLP